MTSLDSLAPIVSRLTTLLFSLSCVVGAAPSAIAVNDLASRGVQASDAAIVSERLRSELVRGGTFRVMDRGQMDIVLREQAFQQSGACDQSECAVQIGKLLSVDQMVVGSVGKLGSLFTLSAQLLDVENGAILLSVNQDFQGPIEELLSQAVPMIAAKLVAGKQGRGADSAVADLFVTSVPAGASIELDGVVRPERTPATLQALPLGVHRLRLSTDSRFGQTEVALVAGDLRKIALELKPGTGTLKVVTHPSGARTLLDGKRFVETPFKQAVPAGTHAIEIRIPGRVPVRDSVLVRPDALLERTFSLPTGREVDLVSGFPRVSLIARDSLRSLSILADTPDQWLADGAWTLALDDPRFEPWSRVVKVDRTLAKLRLDLVPRGAFADSLSAAARSRGRRRTWGWVSAGASLVSFAAAGYLHHDAIAASDRADAAGKAYDAAVFGDDMASLKRDHVAAVKQANRSLVEAWIADASGGVFLATAIVCWSF